MPYFPRIVLTNFSLFYRIQISAQSYVHNNCALIHIWSGGGIVITNHIWYKIFQTSELPFEVWFAPVRPSASSLSRWLPPDIEHIFRALQILGERLRPVFVFSKTKTLLQSPVRVSLSLSNLTTFTWSLCNNLYWSSTLWASPLSPLDRLPPSRDLRGPILFLGFQPFSFRTLSISSFICSSVSRTYFSSPVLSSVSPLGLRKSPIINFVLKLKFSLRMEVMCLFSKYWKMITKLFSRTGSKIIWLTRMMSGYCLNLLPHGATYTTSPLIPDLVYSLIVVSLLQPAWIGAPRSSSSVA